MYIVDWFIGLYSRIDISRKNIFKTVCIAQVFHKIQMSMNCQHLISFLEQSGIPFLKHVSLKSKTWIKRGGIAGVWIQPESVDGLQQVCTYCYAHRLAFEVVGNTSNLYFLDDYCPEIVVSTIKVNHFIETDTELICECGVNIASFASFCVERGIEGYEGFVGLPGTVGSASYNNAGCYGCVMSEVVSSVEVLGEDGRILVLDNEELGYTNRSSVLKRGVVKGVILRCCLKKRMASFPESLVRIASENQEHRKMYGAGYKQNLGCVFASGYENIVKKMPFHLRIVYRLINKLCTVFKIPLLKRQKIKKDLLLFLYRRNDLAPYIADCGILYFLWKDDGADRKFWEYVDFYQKISGCKDLEIEIKGNLNSRMKN